MVEESVCNGLITLITGEKRPEWTPPHWILEKSNVNFNFNFSYVRLCDFDVPRVKWLNYLQKVEALIICRIQWSDLGLHYLLITLLGVYDNNGPHGWRGRGGGGAVHYTLEFIWPYLFSYIANIKVYSHSYICLQKGILFSYTTIRISW